MYYKMWFHSNRSLTFEIGSIRNVAHKVLELPTQGVNLVTKIQNHHVEITLLLFAVASV